jgi:ferredoxin
MSQADAHLFIVHRVLFLFTSFIMLKAILLLNRPGYKVIEKHEKEDKCYSTSSALKMRGIYCNACWDVCPYGKYDYDELFFMNLQLNKHVRELQRWAENTLQKRAELASKRK